MKQPKLIIKSIKADHYHFVLKKRSIFDKSFALSMFLKPKYF